MIFKQYILLTFIALFLLSCGQEKIQTARIADSSAVPEDMPDQISWDAEVIFVDSSFTKAILNADRARVYNERMETLLDGGVKVRFMDKESKKKVSTLTADSARIDDKTKDMLAKGNVVVISDSSNTKLETSLLMWDNKTEKLYSTEFVRITSPNEILEGYGFESDQNLTNYKVMNVSGVRGIDSKK